MSTIHVRKGGEATSMYVEDGMSQSLHRYVNLDTNEVISVLGKQIAGKKLKPGSKTWMEAIQLAKLVWLEDET